MLNRYQHGQLKNKVKENYKSSIISLKKSNNIIKNEVKFIDILVMKSAPLVD